MRTKGYRLVSLFIISLVFILVGCSDSTVKQDDTVNDKYVLEIKNGERFFKSEIAPKSNAEEVILDYFKIEINDEYDKLKNVFREDKVYRFYPETYRAKFNEGLYTENVIIHSLKVLTEEEYSNGSNSIKNYPYMYELKESNPKEFQIVEVVYTNKLTDKLNEIAQWGSGDWTRYFVVVKEKKDSGWKIYDIYGHM